jgi:dephospho-CoA kinase
MIPTKLYIGFMQPIIEAAFPGTLVNGVVDRSRLAAIVLKDAAAMKRLENIVHPMVRADADAFVRRSREAGTKIVVLDIPLLFETGGRDRVDRVVVVSAAADIQRTRVLSRPGMTEEKFEAILARQVPDAEKRALADYVIDTSGGLEAARRQVEAIVDRISGETPRG